MLTPAIWPADVTNSKNRILGSTSCHIANEISTDSHVVLGIRPFDMARYKLSQFTHEDANIGCCCFPLVWLWRFLCTILGLINRLYPYAVRESYLVRGSYGGNKCKSRSRKIFNKTCVYYVGLTPRLPCIYRTIVFVPSQSFSNGRTINYKRIYANALFIQTSTAQWRLYM